MSIVSGIMSVNSLAFLGTLSRSEKQPHEPNLDRVESFNAADDKDVEEGCNTLQRAGDYVRRNRLGSTVSNKKWSRTNGNRRFVYMTKLWNFMSTVCFEWNIISGSLLERVYLWVSAIHKPTSGLGNHKIWSVFLFWVKKCILKSSEQVLVIVIPKLNNPLEPHAQSLAVWSRFQGSNHLLHDLWRPTEICCEWGSNQLSIIVIAPWCGKYPWFCVLDND